MTDPLSDRESQVPPPPAPTEPTTGDSSFPSDDVSSAGDDALAGDDAPSGVSAPPGERRRSRRGRRGGRRRRRGRGGPEGTGPVEAPLPGEPEPSDFADEPGEPEPIPVAAGAADAGSAAPEPGPDGAPRRRRGRRGGRRRRGREDQGARPVEAAPPPDLDEGEAPPAAERDGQGRGDDDGRPRRKRGSRGGRRRKKAGGAVSIEVIPGDDDELPELQELPHDAVLLTPSGAGGAAPAATRGRARDEDDEDHDHDHDHAAEDDEDADDDAPREAPRPNRRRLILVNARDTEEKRVAVVEEGRIVDLQMTVKKHVSYVNDIYRGRVVNLETAIGAAFVDFGEGRNGFLHASDVLTSYGEPDWNLEKLLSTPVAEDGGDEESEGDDGAKDEEEPAGAERTAPERGRGRSRPRARVRLPIESLLKKGQMVAVQITKDAIGDKGPTLTTYISIPGRYLVLMPSLERTGVSRKIDDERERRRLKRILQSLDIPEGMGVIVRTAGIGRTKLEIKRDLDYLLLAWEDFSKRLRNGRNPAPLYQESDVAIRTMRDLFTPETEAVIVDDPEVFQRMVEFTKRLMPEHLDRVKLHEGARPLFHNHGVEQDFEKIFARRVELPSGGSIVIEQTEALVAIDVNSGRTREEGAEFEDIALKTNLEAAPEIARQIRLRDLGGIIVLDYIDMMRGSSRKSVERATREALKADRARAKIGRISQFGLLELTRQRLGPGLSKLVYDTCSRCRGSGRRRNASSRAQAIMRRLAAALALKGYTMVEVRTHPDVIEYLQKELKSELDKLQTESGREIHLLSVPEQIEDSVLHYLRADGREVRPGGRRRR